MRTPYAAPGPSVESKTKEKLGEMFVEGSGVSGERERGKMVLKERGEGRGVRRRSAVGQREGGRKRGGLGGMEAATGGRGRRIGKQTQRGRKWGLEMA